MKVVGISGSPRRGSNSEILLDRALEGAAASGAETEKIILSELDFKPCLECGGCDKTGVCVLKDDMRAVYEAVRGADAVILASPIFFSSISAQAKMMIDRFQCAWIAKYILTAKLPAKRKKGFFISVAGSYRNDSFNNAVSVIRAFFATLDIEYAQEMLCGGIEKAADIVSDEKTLGRAYDMGRGIVPK